MIRQPSSPRGRALYQALVVTAFRYYELKGVWKNTWAEIKPKPPKARRDA